MRETFGQRLARLRKKKGLTQEDVANRITISPQAVSKWENDLSSPDILVLSSLEDILGVSVDELLGRQTSSNAEEKESEQEETKEKDDDVAAEVADEPNASEGIHLTDDGIHIVDDEGERNQTPKKIRDNVKINPVKLLGNFKKEYIIFQKHNKNLSEFSGIKM